MEEEIRILDVVNLDDLDSSLLKKVIHFFNSEYPGIGSKIMDEKFFKSKITNSDSLKSGYLTVAMFKDQVVGTCSAIRKVAYINGRSVECVEIGDTYTSKNFRRNCHFRNLYRETSTTNDYLNKSVFGRLATETLDRAKSDGVEFVYGVPNQQAKLSWIGRLDFELIDGNSTYRVSSPTLTHPSITNRVSRRFLYGIYYQLTLYLSKLITSMYLLERLPSVNEIEHSVFMPTIEENMQMIQLENSINWVQRRFLNNTDKEYVIIQIKSRKNLEVCGYMFFLLQKREDGFRLVINSKELFIKKDLAPLRMPFSRIAINNFFAAENLSIWIDLKITQKFQRFLFGFLVTPIRVDIVAKNLNSSAIDFKSGTRFYNFQYGDSDLG